MARSSLKGVPELRARLKAIKTAFKPIGRKWADETVRLARPGAGHRTGRTARSIRRSDASGIRAKVAGNAPALFKDRGTKGHQITPRGAGTLIFTAGPKTIFARKVFKPRQRGTHFIAKAARQSLKNQPMAKTLIEEWNRAAH